MESAGFTQTCPACHREFSHLGAFSTHLSSCKPKKTRMASALAVAQQYYQQAKKRRLNAQHDRDTVAETPVNTSAPLTAFGSITDKLNVSLIYHASAVPNQR
jgi:hypothetical protein